MKKPWIIAGIVIVILVVGIGGFTFIKKMKSAPESPKPVAKASPKPSPELTSWEDPAGFTLQYPQNLTLNKHEEDEDNYAHLEFTSSEATGSVIVWAKDLPVFKGKTIGTTADWVKNDPTFKDAQTLETKLGDSEGHKILLKSPNKLIVGTVFDGLLWYVEGAYDNTEFWQPVFDIIVGNFSFKADSASKKSDTSVGSDDSSGGSVEEEEIM